MPMLSPCVWVLHAPPDAIRLECPDEAARIVATEGVKVCLPTYRAGFIALLNLGAEPEWAQYLVDAARLQPQVQRTYDANDIAPDGSGDSGR